MPGTALAIDIGGTKIAACLIDETGAMTARKVVPTRHHPDPEEVFQPLAELIDATLAQLTSTLEGVGVGSAGPIEPARGLVSPVNIPAWRGFPLVKRLTEHVPGVPVRLAGDGMCAAAGEHWRGAGQGQDDLLVLVISTGVGGGIIQSGRLIGGESGNAGHLGHMVVNFDGEPCPCGGQGCVEAYSSGPSMVRWAASQGWTGDSAIDLAADARSGSAVARAAFARSGQALAAGIVSAAALGDVSHVVLGGGVSQASDLLLPPLRDQLVHYGQLTFLKDITVTTAALGSDAGLLGAAALIFDPITYPAS